MANFLVGQPVGTPDGYCVVYLGPGARGGRSVVIGQDGTLMNVAENELQPLVFTHDQQVNWLGGVFASEYPEWPNLSASLMPRFRSVARKAHDMWSIGELTCEYGVATPCEPLLIIEP